MKFYRLHPADPIVYGNKRVAGENLRVVRREDGRTGGLEITSMRRDVLADRRGTR